MKTEEGKARLRAAASRVGDTPTGRALKRVRFAADRVEDDAETPEATSASAPSSLPAEGATTNSLPAHSSEAVLLASAVEVPDQVMSEGASGAPDAAVRLSMKRSSDSSHSDFVMLLDDPDVSRAVQQRREVCRRKETFLVDVNDWDCEFHNKLLACGSGCTTVACSSRGTSRNSCRMNRVFSIFLLLPVMAIVICRGKPSGSVFVNTNVASWGRLGIAKNSPQFWSIVQRWRRKTS